MPDESRQPRLALYEGRSSLVTWLNTVALNIFMDRKRRDERERLLMQPTAEEAPDSDEDEKAGRATPIGASPKECDDPPLLDLMRRAIETAFQACAPEDFVLLQLSHCDGLRGLELAVMFRCHPSQITRRLASAQEGIATSVMQYVRQSDPWLDLRWEDFIELCSASTPTCFGLD